MKRGEIGLHDLDDQLPREKGKQHLGLEPKGKPPPCQALFVENTGR